MKKFIYSIIVVVFTSLFIVGCTEQEVKPKGGGAASDPTGAIK